MKYFVSKGQGCVKLFLNIREGTQFQQGQIFYATVYVVSLKNIPILVSGYTSGIQLNTLLHAP